MSNQKREKLEKLQEAQDHINEAIKLIREVVKDSSQERYVEVYMIGHLDNWANSEGGGDTTIPVLMKWFENEDNWDLIKDFADAVHINKPMFV